MLQQRQRQSILQHENVAEKSNMNMTSIHCKLQEEAEKIRKWQTTSEIELKQKIAKLKECELLITKQRNQVLEKQIENENLSAQLQKEQMNQAQINVKLKTARELFIALKNHSENLQTSIVRGEEDRDSLRMLAADNIKQIQDMKSKMQEVVETNERRLAVLKAGIKEKEMAFEELVFSSKSEIDIAKNAKDALQKEVDSCKSEIDNVSRQLLEKRNAISTLQDNIKTLENDKTKHLAIVDSQDTKITELQNMMSETKLAYKSAQECIAKLQQERQDSSDKFNNYKSEAERQIEELQTELTDLTDSLTQLSTQYNEMTSKHDRIESENKTLKESISQLVKCIEDLQEKQESCETEMKGLTETCSSSKKKEQELKDMVQDKDAKLQELSLSKKENETQLKDISESLNCIKLKEVEYVQEIESLMSLNKAKDSKLLELEKKSLELDLHVKTIASDFDEKSLEYNKLEVKCKQIEQDYLSMESKSSGKESELKELVSINEALKQQVQDSLQKMQLLEEEHHHLSHTVSVTQTNFDSCNSQMVSLNDIVQHQEDILAKKDEAVVKLKCQIKSSTQKISELYKTTKQLEQNLAHISSEKEKADKLAEVKINLCHDLEQKNKELQSKVDQLLIEVENSKSLINSAVNDSSDLQKELSDQLHGATARLVEKDLQMKNLASDLADVKRNLSKELNNAHCQKEAYENENMQLKRSISNKDGDISALAEEINKLQNKILKLEDSEKKSSSATKEEFKLLNSKVIFLEKEKNELLEKLAHHQTGQKLSDSEKLKLESLLTEKENDITKLISKREHLESENFKYCSTIQDLNSEIGVLKDNQKNFTVTIQKLNEKEAQLKTTTKNLKELKNEYSTAEEGYMSTINQLKEEIKKLNKSKVETVLSNVSAKSPAPPVESISKSPFSSPIKQSKIVKPESPKTPSVSRSKKRRVAFGKSPSWHATSDDELEEEEEADTTVSSSTSANPSKVKYLSMSKSPKVTTYASAKSPKSPSRLKLSNSKSPGPVSDILAKYPTPSTAQKRGMRLPDAYVKRKEANAKRKQKIEVEARSWFDSDSAFGFDES